MPRLVICLLGPFQVLLDGEPVRCLHSASLRGCLSLLAVESEREHPRRRLADLLWPEQPDRAARSNLRYVLSDLRHALGDVVPETTGKREHLSGSPFLIVTRETVRLNPEADSWLDVREFEWLADAARACGDIQNECELLQAAAHLYRGPLLEGYAYSNSAAFEDWLLWTREQYQRRMIEVLHRLVECHEASGRYEAALVAARWQVQLEPLDEEAHRQLMRSLAGSGQRNAALAHFEQWRETLEKELGAEPMRETTALYDGIRKGALLPFLRESKSQAGPGRSSLEQAPARCGSGAKRSAPGDGAEPAPTGEPGPGLVRPSRFVARQKELARLNQHLAEMLQGHGQVVFVTGEAGSGKTALLREFVRQALGTCAEVVAAYGTCNAATGMGEPYLPFREIMYLLSGDVEAQRAGGAIDSELARRLWSLLPSVAQAIVDQGPGLIDHFISRDTLLMRTESVLLGRTHHAPWHSKLVELRQGRLEGGDGQRAGSVPPDICEQVARVLAEVSRHAPLILTLDDLQWIDTASADLLFYLGRHLEGRHILVLAAYRSPDVSLALPVGRHPLLTVIRELQRDSGRVAIDLDETERRAFLDALLDGEPNRLGADFRDSLCAHTSGHALFTIEMLRELQERGSIVRDAGGRWVAGSDLDWSQVPARVEAVIAERIDRLSEAGQALLAAASVQGEEFTAELAVRVAGMERGEILRLLSNVLQKEHRLVYATRVVWLGEGRISLSRYRFQHALFQEYLYRRLDPVARVRLHELTGEALEQAYAGHTADVAVQLAHHFELAGFVDRAADYWFEAGEQAMHLFAYREARSDFSRSQELLTALPRTPNRTRRQQRAWLAHAWSSSVLGGWGDPSRASAASSALTLAEQSVRTGDVQGDPTGYGADAQLLQAMVLLSRGELASAIAVGQQMLHGAAATGDRQGSMLANYVLGVAAGFSGEPLLSCDYLEAGLGLYSEAEDEHLACEIVGDFKAGFHFWLGFALWGLGYSDRAARILAEGIERARRVDQSLFLGTLLSTYISHRILVRTDADLERLIAELAQLVAVKKMEPLSGLVEFDRGWLLVRRGNTSEGLNQMTRGAESYLRGSTRVGACMHLATLAMTALQAGRSQEGLIAIEWAVPLQQAGLGRFFEAELQRLRVELLLQDLSHKRDELTVDSGVMPEAEAALCGAIETARARGLRFFELRAVMTLARVWRRAGRLAEALTMLEDTYSWFTEGLDLPDLQDAQRLLNELRLEQDERQCRRPPPPPPPAPSSPNPTPTHSPPRP